MSTAVATNRGGKYLTFTLGREGYGIQILKVREIIGYMDITAEQFHQVIEEARTPHLWRMVGEEWQLRYPIWDTTQNGRP